MGFLKKKNLNKNVFFKKKKKVLNPFSKHSEPMMLTPSQLELLRQGETEIDAYLDQSPRLRTFLTRLHPQNGDQPAASTELSSGSANVPFAT